eukprot:5364543-Prymnesium_polylepis.1
MSREIRETQKISHADSSGTISRYKLDTNCQPNCQPNCQHALACVLGSAYEHNMRCIVIPSLWHANVVSIRSSGHVIVLFHKRV